MVAINISYNLEFTIYDYFDRGGYPGGDKGLSIAKLLRPMAIRAITETIEDLGHIDIRVQNATDAEKVAIYLRDVKESRAISVDNTITDLFVSPSLYKTAIKDILKYSAPKFESFCKEFKSIRIA